MRLPDGSTVVRRFRLDATAAELFAWVGGLEALEVLGGQAWTLVLPGGGGGGAGSSTVPAVEGGLMPTDETLDELGIAGVVLVVEECES